MRQLSNHNLISDILKSNIKRGYFKMVLEPKNVNRSNRRRFSPEKKFEIVKEVLVGKVHVSEVCRKYNIDVRQYYSWQKKFLEGAYEAFKNSATGHKRKEQSKEVELERMKNVIAILAEENLTLKKNLGEL